MRAPGTQGTEVIGQSLGRYVIREKLGEGTTAVVYGAEDTVLRRPVVLKLLPVAPAEAGRQTAKFLHEARAASSLNHPNICTIFEIAEAGGLPFIVMERLDGIAVSGIVARGPIEVGRVLEVAVQIADALDAAHRGGIVHRDVKPANIFVTRRGPSKLLDFGVALVPQRQGGETRPQDRASWGGTLPYMSPEQVRGEVVDTRSDLFSLGCTIYEMTTGRRAFVGDAAAVVAAAILSDEPPALASLAPAAPAELDRILRKALEKDRTRRYQKAAELRDDLQQLARALEAAAAPQTSASPANGRGKQGLALSKTWAALAAAGAAAAIMWSVRPVLRGTSGDTARAEAAAPSAPAPETGLRRSTDTDAPRPVPNPAPRRTPGAETRATAGAIGPKASANRPAARPAASEAVLVAAIPVLEAVPERIAPEAAVTLDRELRLARTQAGHRLYDQALATIREAMAVHASGPGLVDAYFAMAAVQEHQQDLDEAMATYLRVGDRFAGHPRAPEALFKLARLTLRADRPEKDDEARRILGDLAARYGESAWVDRALLLRGEIEERRRLYQYDAELNGAAPTAVVLYRQVAGRDAPGPEREDALWRLGRIYEQLKRYELAADTYTTLARDYPGTQFDAWFRAGELYDRKLKDPARARAAYARVPLSSPRFKDAVRRNADDD